MVVKIYIVLVISFLLVVLQAENLKDARSLNNDINKLLRKLREKVDEAMARAHKELDNAEKRVHEIANKIEGEAKSAMEKTINKLREELERLKEKAKNAGVNIDDCLAGNEDRLLNLPNQISSDMVHCVSDRITDGIGYVRDALDQVQKIVDEVENVKKEIKHCGHGFHAVKCLAKLALKIETDITTLPAKIEKDIALTVALITQLEEKIKKCASDKTDKCEKDGEDILKTITLCVGKKIIL